VNCRCRGGLSRSCLDRYLCIASIAVEMLWNSEIIIDPAQMFSACFDCAIDNRVSMISNEIGDGLYIWRYSLDSLGSEVSVYS
jgi:hypothetical protein